MDLEIPKGVNTDTDFLLVAYGLSFPGLDVPLVDSPDQVPPLEFPRNYKPPYAQEEAYWTES